MRIHRGHKLYCTFYLIRILKRDTTNYKEMVHHHTIARTIQASACLRTTKSKDDEDGKPDGDKTESEQSNGTSTLKNLFGTLAGMKAVSSGNANTLQRVKQQGDEMNPLLRRKTESKFTSDFKTSEALKSAMTEAVKTVSESFPDKEKTESDLVQQMRRYDEAKAAGERGDVGAISSLLKGMKVQDTKERSIEEVSGARPEGVDKERPMTWRREEFRAQRVEGGERIQRTGGFRESKRLGIFSLPGEKTKSDTEVVSQDEPPSKTIWDEHEENELKELMQGQHRHGFDQMLEWTHEGKLWKYPIDNEQGLEEEQAIGFHEHVLLDDLIADFPETGPIRDFMELVIIGLSKNPYFTVKQKKEHIDWFRQYFKNKESVLRESEALPKDFSFAA